MKSSFAYFKSNSAVSTGVYGHTSKFICSFIHIIFSPTKFCFIIVANLLSCLCEILKNEINLSYIYNTCFERFYSLHKFFFLRSFLRNCNCLSTIWMHNFLCFRNFPLHCSLKKKCEKNNLIK